VRTADAVVVGGGVVGAAALHYLVELGCARPVLVERDTLGSGSTGHCAGGVRTLFSDELNAQIGLESIRRFQRFEDDVGAELDLRLHGYLFLLDRRDDVDRFEASLELQHRLGIDTELIPPEAALELVPQLDVDGVIACAHNRLAGYLTPDLAVQGYAQKAARGGAAIEQSCAATRIVVEDGCVAGVETSRGPISTERVILTAGIWSRELAATAGVDVPVTPERRFMFFTEAAPSFPHELPLTIDFSTSFYFHREGDGLALGGREQTIEELAPNAVRRLPVVAELGIQSSWWGYYEMSPDHNALIGATVEPEGLVYATGFSGHGFQQGPVVGEHLARLALGLEPVFDLSGFGLERFAEDGLRTEYNVI
jgi:glycine/D-amino acid oxidase-like deaminating enzyme